MVQVTAGIRAGGRRLGSDQGRRHLTASSATGSTLTGASVGRTVTPMALRTYRVPKTSLSSSEASLAAYGRAVKSVVEATSTTALRVRVTLSRPPAWSAATARAFRVATLTAPVPSAGSTTSPRQPVTMSLLSRRDSYPETHTRFPTVMAGMQTARGSVTGGRISPSSAGRWVGVLVAPLPVAS